MLKKTGIFSPYTFAMGDTVVVAFVQNVAFMCASASARIGPNGLEIKKETTHDLV